MAGPHQIWGLDLNAKQVFLHAGDGGEDIVDGRLKESQLAQPSGLATDGRHLFVADSEVSGIRQLDLDTYGTTQTLIGKGLFVFGDRDGRFSEALLQHPLGVAYTPRPSLYSRYF